MFNLLNYISFLWSSKNAHGIHSPFVYDLYTKGLKNKTFKNKSRLLRGLIRYIKYKEIQTIYCSPKTEYLSSELNYKSTEDPNDAQLICCSIKEFEVIIKLKQLQKCPIFITEINTNTILKSKWDELCNDVNYQVTIDCYHFGLLFFRPNQRKEHFKLRL